MITKQTFATVHGEITHLTLTNALGCTVVLTSVGAGVVALNVPDRDGNMADVALGYADPADYIGDGPCSGKIPGRYANRIAKGKFAIDGVEFTLPINNGPNCNHGGENGFHNKIWTVESAEGNTVVFSLHSPDGDSGFPGNLDVQAAYTWTDDNELQLTIQAVSDAKTVVNLTNHTYWNLAGHNSGSVLNHYMQLAASKFLPTDDTLIPDGTLVDVAGTPMDFTTEKPIGRDIKEPFAALIYGKGYDNCWVADGWQPGRIAPVAYLFDETTGRMLTVSSDQPGVQVYTGNWLAGSPKNKDGRSYDDYDGVAIECQGFPNSPNTPAFPSTLLEPGCTYTRHINFKFNIK